MTVRTCDKCGKEFDTGECGTNHCEDEVELDLDDTIKALKDNK